MWGEDLSELKLLFAGVVDANVFLDSGVAADTGICKFAMGGGLAAACRSRACFNWSARATILPFAHSF
jgi:hypothetical protein